MLSVWPLNNEPFITIMAFFFYYIFFLAFIFLLKTTPSGIELYSH